MSSCRIECERCGREFDAPLQFDDEQSYFSSELVGTQVPCEKCGLMTPCVPEYMTFVGEPVEDDDSEDWKDYAGRDI